MPVALTAALQILMEVLAAAPGVESTVEDAIHAWHASGASTSAKIATISQAADQLSQVASVVAMQPAPGQEPNTSAGVGTGTGPAA